MNSLATKSLASQFKIRASQLSQIMTNPRTKSETLSKTTISYLEQWIKEAKYGRRVDLSNVDAIAKGIECENEAIHVLNKALGTNYKKAKYLPWEKMENDRCTGHEDIDCGEIILEDGSTICATIDTKVSSSFATFPLFPEEADKAYYRQGQAYMRLKGEDYKRHTIAKVLVNTPVWMIEQKLYYLYNNLCKKYNDNLEFVDMEYELQARQIFLNNVFDQQISIHSNGLTLRLEDHEFIPLQERVHLTVIERNDTDIARIADRVQACRDRLIAQGF